MNSNAALDLSEDAKIRFLQATQALQDLPRVEQLIKSKLVSDAPLLEEIPKYLLELGGKRMRPMLTLMCHQALGCKTSPQSLIDVAAGIELIHMATLLHDDIIDNSPLRRHKESALIKFGQSETLLSGDFLLVRAFSLCSKLDLAIIDATEVACIELTEGEILEVPLYRQKHDLQSVITIAKKKTAALFRLAAFSAAHIATGDARVSASFAEFGENLGIAFQILDDVLDVISNEDLLGKKSGTDLRERKPAIINVLWLETGEALAEKLKSPAGADEEEFVAAALQYLRTPGNAVVSKAREHANNYAEKARQALLSGIQDVKSVDHQIVEGLLGLIDYTLARLV